MTDLERKLAETLREQGGEVTPDLAGAWAEQLRRQRRPRAARRRLTVLVAPLAAVLVVLTSVLLATQLNSAPTPVPPASRGQELTLPKPEYSPVGLVEKGEPIALTDFAGQTDNWTSYAVFASAMGTTLFCVEAFPKGLTGAPVHGEVASQFGTKSPSCVPLSTGTVCAGYVGETGGPLPAGKAIYLVNPAVRELSLFDAKGDLSQAKRVGMLGQQQLFLADVTPGSPPVRFDVSSDEARPASR
ncbi:hypothetical protein [Amycolatopsis sp. NBC_01286]|uniref:hypothetical protein n=1 Tax=Amycolatopsis sp. NBC_01286 TaxID=2903560 RepID=UPI002E118EA5|nr:hypothetical protein OG570_11610 [Amycolatopsis sp. NBC_01286]